MCPYELTKFKSVVAGFDGLASSLVCRGRTEIIHKGVALTQGTGFKQLISFESLYLFNFNEIIRICIYRSYKNNLNTT